MGMVKLYVKENMVGMVASVPDDMVIRFMFETLAVTRDRDNEINPGVEQPHQVEAVEKGRTEKENPEQPEVVSTPAGNEKDDSAPANDPGAESTDRRVIGGVVRKNFVKKLKKLAEDGLPDSRLEIMKKIGLAVCGQGYKQLAGMAEKEGIALPVMKKSGRKPQTFEDDENRVRRVIKKIDEKEICVMPKIDILKRAGLENNSHGYMVLKRVAAELGIALVGKKYKKPAGKNYQKPAERKLSHRVEKDIMKEFYISKLDIEKIAAVFGVPALRVTQIVTSDAGKLYGSVNADDPTEKLRQFHRDDLKQKQEEGGDAEVTT